MGNYLLNNPDGHIPALICAENIAELCEKQSSVGIRMRAHIRELAESLIKMAELSQKEHSARRSAENRYILSEISSKYENIDVRTEFLRKSSFTADDMRSLYHKFCPFSGNKGDAGDKEVLSLNRPESEFNNVLLRAELCLNLCLMTDRQTLEKMTPQGMLGAMISPAEGLSVSYLQNLYSDTAFENLSPILCGTDNPDRFPEKILCDDLQSVCDYVESGRSSYCILPIENLSDGRLGGVRKLLLNYDLKIAHTVALKQSGLVFGLLRKNLGIINSAESGPLYYEFTLHGGEKPKLGEIFHAAEYLGHKVHRIESLPLSYSDTDYLYDVILTCQNGEERLLAFILYVILEAPGFSAVGIYRHSEINNS